MTVCSEVLSMFEGYLSQSEGAAPRMFPARKTKMVQTADGSIAKVLQRRDEEYAYESNVSKISGTDALGKDIAKDIASGIPKHQAIQNRRDKFYAKNTSGPAASYAPSSYSNAHSPSSAKYAARGQGGQSGGHMVTPINDRKNGQGLSILRNRHGKFLDTGGHSKSDWSRDDGGKVKPLNQVGGFEWKTPERKQAAPLTQHQKNMAFKGKSTIGARISHFFSKKHESGDADYDIENPHQPIPPGQGVRRVDPAALDALNARQKTEWVEASAPGQEARTGLVAQKQAYKKRNGNFGFDPRAAMKANIQGRARESYSIDERAKPKDVRDADGTVTHYTYDVPVARRTKDGKVQLNKSKYDYSHTTRCHRNKFLGHDSKEMARRIKSGEYEVVDFE